MMELFALLFVIYKMFCYLLVRFSPSKHFSFKRLSHDMSERLSTIHEYKFTVFVFDVYVKFIHISKWLSYRSSRIQLISLEYKCMHKIYHEPYLSMKAFAQFKHGINQVLNFLIDERENTWIWNLFQHWNEMYH